jgi:exopolyphosphatase/guanosine-5'-triphosphate,3'-diphosphate pyrophosphatase
VIYGEGDRLKTHTSLEIGSVRLTEKFIGYGAVDPGAFARLRAYVEETVFPLEIPGLPRTAVAVAGTATTLAAMELGLSSYEPAKVHGSTLTLTALRRHVDRLLEASPEERRALVAVSPERADVLLAGAIILIHILEKTRRQAYKISDRGLRYGLLV